MGALTPHFGRYVPRQSENAGLQSELEHENAGLRSELERESGVSGTDWSVTPERCALRPGYL